MGSWQRTQDEKLTAYTRQHEKLAAYTRQHEKLAAYTRQHEKLAAYTRQDEKLAAYTRQHEKLAAYTRQDEKLAAYTRQHEKLADKRRRETCSNRSQPSDKRGHQSGRSMEYVKALLQHGNVTGSFNGSLYNFTGAESILTAFSLTVGFNACVHRQNFNVISYSSVVLLTLYLAIFLTALAGNLMVIVALILQDLSWRANHVYLLNLAICDLLVTLICMPSTVTTIIYKLWLTGLVICKLAPFLQGVAVATGIFTLTAMSVDRYLSIQHPSHAHWSSAPSSAVVLTVITWTTSSVFMAPQLYVRTIDTLSLPDLPAMTFCIEDWPDDLDRQIFSFLLLMLVYVIPVLIVAVCYANVGKMLCTLSFRGGSSSDVYVYSRRRAARILILLVGLFICCWLPYNVMSLIVDIQELSSLMPFFTIRLVVWACA
ncbi:QRFP-like peptide receptor [Physella acuta]|uniref:QRFP-like peptide receptor n=1 Tax=Physella acuta TaxID=109671 RepID=UPI0027DB98AA|nr:QRFP-like peptide receptor [Physella acuta]